MLRRLIFVATAVVLGCGASPDTVQMKAENDSGENGTAVLTQKGNDLEVKIQLSKGSDTGAQPAHIHKGSCPGLGEIVKALNPVQEGVSTTLLTNTKLEEVSGSKFVVNVHNSTQGSVYVSCGVIP